jgi:Ni,Fe-hydrogenase III large subunit/Ni,Fe-hydrogenase III component G
MTNARPTPRPRRDPRIPHADVLAVASASELARETVRLLADGFRLALVAAHHDGRDHPDGEGFRIVYLFTAGPPDRRVELHLRADAAEPHIPSLAALSFSASRFEREMRDMYGIEPDNHPQPRRLVHHPHWPAGWHPMRQDAPQRPPLNALEPFPFVEVEGPGVYEIPVGPVHAGLIEPGHFRFSVVGETILKLKARLWYVHKGIEKLAEAKSADEVTSLAERVSGDTAIGHTLAYSLAVEDACGIAAPPDAQAARAMLLELERMHNHIADIGALCNDCGYGIAHAHAQRIRERMLRLNQRVTGHRLLRGGIFPGGANLRDMPQPAEITAIAADVADIVELALKHTVVRDRLTGTAILSQQQARDIGVLGYAARASGIGLDARRAHPHAWLPETFAVPVHHDGDVLSRFLVRADELQISAAIVTELAGRLKPGRWIVAPLPSPGRRAGIGIAEGWRGTIVHRVELDPDNTISRLKIVDPSFLTWPALPVALADTIVPDFPLTNKSFNLSYAGNDL